MKNLPESRPLIRVYRIRRKDRQMEGNELSGERGAADEKR